MSTAKERAGQILAEHFPPKWSNENLRDRVLEFGAAIYAQAIEDAAQVVLQGKDIQGLARVTIATRIRALGYGDAMDVMRHVMQLAHILRKASK